MSVSSHPSPGCGAWAAAMGGAAIAAPFVAWDSPGPYSYGPDIYLWVAVAAFLVAGAHVGFLAVPLYMVLESRIRPGLMTILAAGALVGALPISLLIIATGETRDVPEPALVCGMCGLTGAFAFWLAFRLERSG